MSPPPSHRARRLGGRERLRAMPTLQARRDRKHPSVLSISKRQTENDIRMPDTVFAVRSARAPYQPFGTSTSTISTRRGFADSLSNIGRRSEWPARRLPIGLGGSNTNSRHRVRRGKFCIIGDLTTDAEFVGVEQRSDLVGIARSAGASVGASKATFVHANVDCFRSTGSTASTCTTRSTSTSASS